MDCNKFNFGDKIMKSVEAGITIDVGYFEEVVGRKPRTQICARKKV